MAKLVNNCRCYSPEMSTQTLFQCQEAKWVLSNYDNGFQDGLEELSRDDLFWWCVDECGSGKCDHFYAHDFENHDNCDRTGLHKLFYIGSTTSD